MHHSIRKQIFGHTAFVILFALILSSYCVAFATHLNETEPVLAVTAGVGATEPKCIVLDAGHGGEDGGTVGVNGILEKDLNLSLSQVLGVILEFSGYKVIQTRTEDKLLYDKNENYYGKKKVLDLKGRLDIAQGAEPDIFIGIHMNAFPQQKYSGLNVYYSKNDPSSQSAAQMIQSDVKYFLQPNNNREIKAANSSIYILDRIKYPAILIECGFLSNPAECGQLSTYDYRHKLSLVFYSSIVSFLEK